MGFGPHRDERCQKSKQNNLQRICHFVVLLLFCPDINFVFCYFLRTLQFNTNEQVQIYSMQQLTQTTPRASSCSWIMNEVLCIALQWGVALDRGAQKTVYANMDKLFL